MKHFMVSDEIGNALYFDHPRGRLLCMPIPTAQELMKENFNEKFSAITCGNTLVIFEQFEHLTFTAISDEGEPESYLRNELRLVHELLLFKFGRSVLYNKRRPNFLRHQKVLQPIIDTMCHLAKTRQSFLVQAREMLEVNDDIRNRCQTTIKRALDRLPNAVHGLLFVGTKLLSIYSKTKAFELNNTDILLLIAFCKGHFNPTTRTTTEAEISVSDYSKKDEQDKDSTDEGFVSATEEWEDDVPAAAKHVSEQLLFYKKEAADIFDEIIERIEGVTTLDSDLETGRRLLQNLLIFVLANVGDGTTSGNIVRILELRNILEDGVSNPNTDIVLNPKQLAHPPTFSYEVKILQFLLDALGYYEGEVNGLISANLGKAIKKFQGQHSITQELNVDLIASSETVKLLVQKVARSNPLDLSNMKKNDSNSETDTPEKSADNDKSSVNSGNGGSGGTGSGRVRGGTETPEEAVHKEVDPIYQMVHLRTSDRSYQPFWLYSAKMRGNLTLVVINENATGSAEELEQLNIVDISLNSLLRNYIDYLAIKERTHLSILTYTHQLPGLVHFIYVDRTTNRIIAPTIGPLHGQQYVPQEETTTHMINLIKQKVWDMCYQAHKHLAMGYYSMLMKSGDFQYSYRFLMEDNEGFEIPLESSPSPTGTISNSFYKDLLKKNKGARCFELFSLYLGIVSVNIVANHDRELLAQLSRQ